MGTVGSGPQTRWARLSRMTWAEVRTRVGQEISKQLDLASYRAGLRPKPRLLQDGAQANFFFAQSDLAQRAALLRTHLPSEVDALSHEADDICRHHIHLLGYERVEYGPSIDWHLDPIHGNRSPLIVWFKVPYLEFKFVGDHKIIWELNRHQHLVTLAKAWVLSGNPDYARECTAQFYSWQEENPYPLGINWASTLEVAFRSMSWLWIRFLLAGCSELPASFWTDLLRALESHGRYIERYLSTYFSPNTHLLGEASALFFLGTLCPQIAGAGRWREKGWKILLEESERQVRPDGVYFEQALYYHVYALDFFLHARILAARNGFSVPESFDGTIKKMLDVVEALSAIGPPESFGDDDGGRMFNPRRNRTEHMSDPLAIGAVLYDSDTYTRATLTEEAVWLFGDQAVKVLQRKRAATSLPKKAFEDGGIYLIEDDDPSPQQMAIDAGPQGMGHSGHGHADALSIRYSLDRQRFLIDSGTYSYVSDLEDRDRFRGTSAHNTLRVDSLDQAVPEGPFAWSSLPKIHTETWCHGRTFDLFIGSHDGYCRLADPVVHRRFVFHFKKGFWFIRDLATGRGLHQLETSWHFAPDLQLRGQPGVVIAESYRSENAGLGRLALLLDEHSPWNAQITDTFVSPAYGSKQRAPVVRITAKTKLPAECGVLLLPMSQQDSRLGRLIGLAASAAHSVRGYRYQTLPSTEFLIFASEERAWTCGDWTSDAELLYCRLENGRFTHVIMVDGSFAEWRGRRFISHPSPAKIFEWASDSDTENAVPADNSVAGIIGDFEVFDSVP